MNPAPALVGLDVVKKDISRRAAVLLELLADDVLPVLVRDVDMHLLPHPDFAANPPQVLRHRVILPRKRDPLRPRPGEPGGGVAVPLGRKGVAEGGGGT